MKSLGFTWSLSEWVQVVKGRHDVDSWGRCHRCCGPSVSSESGKVWLLGRRLRWNMVIYHVFFHFPFLKLCFMIPKSPSLSKPRLPTSRSMDEGTRWSIISFNCGPAQSSTDCAQAIAINAIAKNENNVTIGPQYILPYTVDRHTVAQTNQDFWRVMGQPMVRGVSRGC